MEKESGCPDAEQEKAKERETKIKDAIDGHHNALIAEIKGLSGKMTELQKTVENAVKSKKDDKEDLENTDDARANSIPSKHLRSLRHLII